MENFNPYTKRPTPCPRCNGAGCYVQIIEESPPAVRYSLDEPPMSYEFKTERVSCSSCGGRGFV